MLDVQCRAYIVEHTSYTVDEEQLIGGKKSMVEAALTRAVFSTE